MDHQDLVLESRRSSSFGRLSSASSSRRRSLNVFSLPRHSDDAIEGESVSEAGDIGDRALHSSRVSASGRSHFSLENLAENGAVVPIQEGNLLQPYSDASFPVTPPLENTSPLSVDAIVQHGEKEIVSSFLSCDPLVLSNDRLRAISSFCYIVVSWINSNSRLVKSFLMFSAG